MPKKRTSKKPAGTVVLGTYTTDTSDPQTGTIMVAATAANDAFERVIAAVDANSTLGRLRDARNATKAVLDHHQPSGE